MAMKRYKISLWVLKNVLKYFQHEKLISYLQVAMWYSIYLFIIWAPMKYQSFHLKMFLKYFMCEDIMFSCEHSLGIYVVISFILVTCLLDIVLISTDINPLTL